ncbi:MAG: DUF2157 domain-containing protein [Bacteroidota bacterium]
MSSQTDKPDQTILFSVYWELKVLLYLGVLLLSSGLGILIYKNIDTIGHQVIIGLVFALSAGCFYYCFKHGLPFSKQHVKTEGPLFDYSLLLGCLSFLTVIGYLQTEYTLFGNNYRLSTFIPMVVLFFMAYRFDHLGVLSMAITNLGIWLGVTATTFNFFTSSGYESRAVIFREDTLLYVYLGLGLLLIGLGYLSDRLDIKKHFRFTYQHFGVHMAFIALLSGYFSHFDDATGLLWPLALFTLATLLYFDALRHRSFYFILLVCIYGYVAFSAMILKAFSKLQGDGLLYIAFLYFIISAFVLIKVLIAINRKIKGNDHL